MKDDVVLLHAGTEGSTYPDIRKCSKQLTNVSQPLSAGLTVGQCKVADDILNPRMSDYTNY